MAEPLLSGVPTRHSGEAEVLIVMSKLYFGSTARYFLAMSIDSTTLYPLDKRFAASLDSFFP